MTNNVKMMIISISEGKNKTAEINERTLSKLQYDNCHYSSMELETDL